MRQEKRSKRAHKMVVITRVDKASKCLTIICKACYKRLSKDELNSPGYSEVQGESLESTTVEIVQRQTTFLEPEHLPVPKVSITDPETEEESIVNTKKQPVRYLMPKLHKEVPAFRGITACCGTITEGIAKIVTAILVGIRPVLHALWREQCIRIGIAANECWITTGGADIVDIIQDRDQTAQMEGNVQPHEFETFDFVAMYPSIPVTCLKQKMKELLGLVFEYQEKNFGFKSMYVK